MIGIKIRTEGTCSLGLKPIDLVLAVAEVGDAPAFGPFVKFPPPRPYAP